MVKTHQQQQKDQHEEDSIDKSERKQVAKKLRKQIKPYKELFTGLRTTEIWASSYYLVFLGRR